MIIFSGIPVVGCGVYTRPQKEGVKPSPATAKTLIKTELFVKIINIDYQDAPINTISFDKMWMLGKEPQTFF